MRPFVFAVFVLSTVIVLGGMAEAQNAELSAPPDVAISNWIPLAESFGFVIVNAGKTTKPKIGFGGICVLLAKLCCSRLLHLRG